MSEPEMDDQQRGRETIVCSACGTANVAGDHYCAECGTPLPVPALAADRETPADPLTLPPGVSTLMLPDVPRNRIKSTPPGSSARGRPP